jgi:hypothetical protein
MNGVRLIIDYFSEFKVDEEGRLYYWTKLKFW